MKQRIVEVSKEFYAQLAEYLLPVERWNDKELGGSNLVLVSVDFSNGESHQLVFKVKDDGHNQPTS